MVSSPATARRDVDARGAAVSSSPNVAGTISGGFTVDNRVRLLSQLRTERFSLVEHPDQYSIGWNCGAANALRLAIATLFPLPVPTYSCRFPTDSVSVGLRELASAAFADVVAVDLSDCGDR